MFETNEEMLYEDPSKTFAGVQFVLFGFDFSNQEKIRSKLVDGGGVDVGRYGPDCTHVIVDKIAYDDPICATARSDGKTLVTGLWVHHSFDLGTPVDPASIMYRPLRDLNGITGAKSLVICLTGYPRQDREDIMTMVTLIGAKFSKPLVANKVTHLICYKFEGEKYDLAKKMKKIKLVNHCWLEDCLRAWELLPEADYDKSGHELEMMAAQAKDSEDEAEDMAKKQHGERGIVATPQSSRLQVRSPGQSLMLKDEASRNILDPPVSGGLTDTGIYNETVSTSKKEASPNQIQVKEILNRCLERLGSSDKSPIAEAVQSDLASASGSYKNSPPTASKLNSVGYSRRTPRKASLPLELAQMERNSGALPIVDAGKLDAGNEFNLSSSKRGEEDTIFSGVKTLLKENLSHPEESQSDKLPEKRKVAVSCCNFKSQKTCQSSEFISEGALMANVIEVPPSASMLNGAQEMTHHHSPGSSAHYLGNNGDLDLMWQCPPNISSSVTPEIGQECSEKAPKKSFETSKSTTLDSKKLETTDVFGRPDDPVDDATETQHGPHSVDVLCPGTGAAIADFDLQREGDANSRSKQPRRKLLAKKTLGSRPSFGRGKSLNQKGSIFMNKKESQKNSATESIGEIKNADLERFGKPEKIKMVFATSNADVDKNIEIKRLSESGNGAPERTGFRDDETESPEAKEKTELGDTVCKGNSGDAITPNPVNTRVHIDDNTLDMEDQQEISSKDDLKTKAEIVASDKNMELSESLLVDNDENEKTISVKERSSIKTKKNNVGPVTKLANSKGERRKASKCKMIDEKTVKKNSLEAEKENRPVSIGEQNVSHNKEHAGKVTPKSNTKSLKTDTLVLKEQKEPVWFILSGHKLQRKEFQQVIKHLKGRMCRDSHQWSYQATHFIVPHPIRRTEKLFAAAASGRWILKTDYLTASSEAGKFLAEEPYEWHKNGLSEDGAINLEAPRKWRLVRKRTGHGAFYGMRIIVYGDCIAPPLDTLKRVVKAGDGTILATSPPYSRFLESGVDFAIVSPGVARVDIWIQEFLRHEIPCILADYLVDYVCKPGYSLERHVQYNTHTWAEKSFRKLVSNMEEIVEDLNPQEDHHHDVSCRVCGSRDRGEAMLICGDESGSSGCGVGTHIDCCDPPLEEIPEEDWFCPNCSSNRNSKSTPKYSRKRAKKTC